MEQEVKLLIVLWTFLGLGTVTVGLRCYVRLAISKSFGIDDWFMVIGYVSFFARADRLSADCSLTWLLEALFASLVGVLVTSIYYGLGKHAADLKPYQQINAAMVSYPCVAG